MGDIVDMVGGWQWVVRYGLIGVTIGVLMGGAAYCIFLERKISAWVQDRRGPNRVGPWGLLQSIADGGKMLLKEDVIPGCVEKPLFLLAPCIAFMPALLTFAVIPWGGTVVLGGQKVLIQVASVDIGLLYILSLAGVGTYGIIIGGWASNSKYSFLGAFRSISMMLSYEIPLGLCILVAVLVAGELRLEEIVDYQAKHGWLVLAHPLTFLILVICVFAETNRLPFDMAESEQELVGGFHTEYSAMKFGMFFLGEYCHIMIGSAFVVALFLGGSHLPLGLSLHGNDSILAGLLQVGIYWAKIVVFIVLFMWVRWTLPRFRYDQILRIAWQGLMPMMMATVAITGFMLVMGWHEWWQMLLSNVPVAAGAYWVMSRKPAAAITGRQPNLPEVAVKL